MAPSDLPPDGSKQPVSIATEQTPESTDYLAVRLTNGTAWYQAGGSGGGGLTDAELRAAPVPITGSLEVEFPPSLAVTGPVTDAQLRATPVTVSGTVTANVGTGTQPVSGTVTANAGTGPWPVTDNDGSLTVDGTVGISGSVAVTGPVTDAQLRATPVPVSGTFWQATQPVSGPLTDAQLRGSLVPVTARVTDGTNTAVVKGAGAAPVVGDAALTVSISPNSSNFLIPQPVSDNGGSLTVDGTVAVSNFPASQAVTGTFWQATQPVSGTVTLATNAAASSTPQAVVSLGNSQGKVNVMQTGTLVTTSVTANQVILTYTVTAGKTFYLTYFDFVARLTTFAATATNFGAVSLESPAATKLYTSGFFAAGAAEARQITFSEPVPIAAGVVIRIVVTPSATTSFTWFANLGGYEK